MERLRYARAWRPAIEAITRLPFDAAIKLMVSYPLALALK